VSNPFFTVIIPTFNRPLELKRAVNSVLSQKYQDFEVIIVNNGSIPVDNAYNDLRVIDVKEEKKGANYARNLGISIAKGKFICFLDDDDEYLDHHLSALYSLIKENKEMPGLYRTFTIREVKPGVYENQEYTLCHDQEKRMQAAMTTTIVMHCVCLHKTVTEVFKFDPAIKVAQDYHMWLRVLTKFPLFETPEFTTIYHISSVSTSNPSLEKYLNYIKVYSSLFAIKDIGSRIKPHTKRDRLFRYYFWLLAEHGNELRPDVFFTELFGAIINKPGFIFEKAMLKIVFKYIVSGFGLRNKKPYGQLV
jgi:glycosyltransferase involved in cell wall biosynthesis